MKKNTASERVSFTDGYRAPDNAQAVKENNTAGINRIVKLSAVINGEIISSFKHFKLKQSAVTHHEFELTLAHDALL